LANEKNKFLHLNKHTHLETPFAVDIIGNYPIGKEKLKEKVKQVLLE